MTVLLVMRSPPAITPSLSILSTAWPNRTSTPSSSRCSFAASERLGANVPRTFGAASMRTIRADVGSTRRNSDRNVVRTSTARAAAISTPVGPAPTRTNVNRSRWRLISGSASASSNALRILFRIAAASARLFKPGANFSNSLCPK